MTIRELAKLAGVSPATVSIVLNGRKGVGQETRDRILAIAQEHSYELPHKGEAPKRVIFVKHRKHGMLVEENQGFISAIMDEVESQCAELGHSLSIVQSYDNLEEVLKNIDYAAYCGVIVLATEIDPSAFHQLDLIPIPYVVVDNSMRNFPCSSVGISNSENVRFAMEHCAGLGHYDIAHFRSSIPICNFVERNEAFRRSARELGIRFDKKNEFYLEPTLMGAYEDMKKYLKANMKLPRCAFADNDTIAIGAMKALKECGYWVPDDISVIGFDDITFAAIHTPALTTVRVEKKKLGKLAVWLLFELIDKDKDLNAKISITGQVIERTSMRRLAGGI